MKFLCQRREARLYSNEVSHYIPDGPSAINWGE
jgi:hypothetical protein